MKRTAKVTLVLMGATTLAACSGDVPPGMPSQNPAALYRNVDQCVQGGAFNTAACKRGFEDRCKTGSGSDCDRRPVSSGSGGGYYAYRYGAYSEPYRFGWSPPASPSRPNAVALRGTSPVFSPSAMHTSVPSVGTPRGGFGSTGRGVGTVSS